MTAPTVRPLPPFSAGRARMVERLLNSAIEKARADLALAEATLAEAEGALAAWERGESSDAVDAWAEFFATNKPMYTKKEG